MFAFLLSVGILVTIVGCFTIGFGIPNNGFDLGNTLLIMGTTAVCAGLVLIGLAACLRELRRICEALPARLGARAGRGLDQAEQPVVAGPRAAQSPRMPYPAIPDGAPREPRQPEPHLVPQPPEPVPGEEPALEQRPRPNIHPLARSPGDAPPLNEPEGVPMAASRGPTAPLGRTLPPPIEPPYEPKFGPADILARLGGQGRAAAKGEPARPLAAGERTPERTAANEPPIEPSQPPAKERPRGPVFDAVWPSAGKPPGRAAAPDTIPRAPRSEVQPEPKAEARERYEPPPLRSEPPMGSDPRNAAPPRPDARTVSILKSGVIDGMAYTLYTDGSIEAQLPQGTMHFASIEELRMHLENQG